MPRVGNPVTRSLLDAIEDAGAHVEQTKKQHWKVLHGGRVICTLSNTMSDHRAQRNAIAQLRRGGLHINYRPR
ncbi:hypothetical protein [Mycolicibacterium fortuitum]|uniref:hypothetical protein n=1 Tax=Mycolicibacterium fortuitum TaxID=1766 RepID=UPI00262B0DCF|nr:hypothetical protein [Mycolicibacterium fortuitum]